MSTRSHVGTNTVGHGTTSSIVHLLGNLAETSSGTHGSLPCIWVHGKFLKVDHVDGDGSIRASEAIIAVRVTSGFGLNLNAVGIGALDDTRNILCRLRSDNRGWGDGDVEVVGFNPLDLVKGIIGVAGKVRSAVAHCVDASLQSAGRVTHGGDVQRRSTGSAERTLMQYVLL